MSNWGFVVAAYGLTWVVLSVYAIQINRRVKRAAAGLERLAEAAEAAHAPVPQSAADAANSIDERDGGEEVRIS